MVYNQQHNFAKFKDISDFREMSLDSMRKNLNEFRKRFTSFKKLSPHTENNEDLKARVLDSSGDFLNDLYYGY